MKNSKKKVAGGAVVVVVVVVVVAFDEKSIDYGNAMPAYANEEPATTPGRHLGRTRVFFLFISTGESKPTAGGELGFNTKEK